VVARTHHPEARAGGAAGLLSRKTHDINNNKVYKDKKTD
jgi:hypothetical protein